MRVEDDGALAPAFDAVRAELGIEVGFPPSVTAAAEAAAVRGPSVTAEVDLRDVEFVTVDPPGSRDLDQAVAIERRPAGGYPLRYAIADVAAFVEPGDEIDVEARRRGVTVYLPDGRAPLHPPVLSEGAASLLPGEERQALVWELPLDRDGRPESVSLRRARVRSRRAWSYAEVQAALDAGVAEDVFVLLREVGRLREALEAERGGVSLPIPDQVVVPAAGRYELAFRSPLPVEGWNAQVSLLAGTCAARLMVDAGVGVLRTLPPPGTGTVDALRRRADALDVPWPSDGGYQAFVRSLDGRVPDHAALLVQAARLFRGAGYEAFDGSAPATPEHAAVAAPYAHVTAPLRRLVDRFANEVVLAACAGSDIPMWVRDALPLLPDLMAEARRREGAADRMALDVVEAAVLGGCAGCILDGVVVDVDEGRAQVQIRRPAVVATVRTDRLGLGDEVRLRVVDTDVVARRVTLEVDGRA